MEATYTNRATKIGMVIALYWVVSISMVFLNKYLLSSPDLRLDAPLFITWFQCLVAVVACWVLPLFRPLHPFFETFPRFEVKVDVALKCLPLSAVFVGMIAFNNLCLKEIGVSFYNVGRYSFVSHTHARTHTQRTHAQRTHARIVLLTLGPSSNPQLADHHLERAAYVPHAGTEDQPQGS